MLWEGSSMKVKQLIQFLETKNPELEVLVYSEGWFAEFCGCPNENVLNGHSDKEGEEYVVLAT
jgi:hypothetical protein